MNVNSGLVKKISFVLTFLFVFSVVGLSVFYLAGESTLLIGTPSYLVFLFSGFLLPV
jgi:amino acid transporter